MTKTFCDRCGHEGPVKMAALKSSDGRSSDMLLERNWNTDRIIDVCDACLAHLKSQFSASSVVRCGK